MLVKLDHLPSDRDENLKKMKPPPSVSCRPGCPGASQDGINTPRNCNKTDTKNGRRGSFACNIRLMGRNLAPDEVGSFSHYLRAFDIPGGAGFPPSTLWLFLLEICIGEYQGWLKHEKTI